MVENDLHLIISTLQNLYQQYLNCDKLICIILKTVGSVRHLVCIFLLTLKIQRELKLKAEIEGSAQNENFTFDRVTLTPN
jgi:hypothetical protein